MPIEIACPSCHKRMRAPDAAAGKHVKCPACQAPIVVPAPRPAAPIERWTLLAENDQQFGPIPRSELDQWFAEGRISAQCQLLREGAPAWQWASEIYPSLAQKPAPTPQPQAVADPLGLGHSPNPYVAPRATSAATAPRTYRGPRSGGANLVTTMAYVAGGTIVARALIWIAFTALAVSSVVSDFRYQTGAAVATTIMAVIIIFVAALTSAPYFVAGVGLGKRRLWGKIMGFVTAGLSCIVALLLLIQLLRSIIGYARFSTIGFSMPAEFHLRYAGMILLELIFLAVMVGHAIVTLMVLLNSKNANEYT